MFASRPKNIIYINSKQLAIEGEGISETETLTFIPDIIKNLEVINRESFKTSIYTFIGKTDIKRQKIICVLGEDLLFEKRLPFESIERIKEEKEKFIKELPFDPSHVVCVTLAKDKEVYFVATNKDIYSLVKEGFESMGWKIEAVVPIFVFPDLRHKEMLAPDDVEKLLINKKLIEASNFLEVLNGAMPIPHEEVQKDPKQDESKKTHMHEEDIVAAKTVVEGDKSSDINSLSMQPKSQRRKKSPVFFLIFLIIILVVLVGGGYYFVGKKGLSSLHMMLAKPTPTAVPTVVPTATPIPTPSIAKKDVVISVLNGTTIAGLASKVKSQLVPLGYTSITTGNADNQNVTTTTVAFSTRVSQSIQTEITDTLKKTFSTVSIASTPPTGTTDVAIIAGTP